MYAFARPLWVRRSERSSRVTTSSVPRVTMSSFDSPGTRPRSGRAVKSLRGSAGLLLQLAGRPLRDLRGLVGDLLRRAGALLDRPLDRLRGLLQVGLRLLDHGSCRVRDGLHALLNDGLYRPARLLEDSQPRLGGLLADRNEVRRRAVQRPSADPPPTVRTVRRALFHGAPAIRTLHVDPAGPYGLILERPCGPRNLGRPSQGRHATPSARATSLSAGCGTRCRSHGDGSPPRTSPRTRTPGGGGQSDREDGSSRGASRRGRRRRGSPGRRSGPSRCGPQSRSGPRPGSLRAGARWTPPG